MAFPGTYNFNYYRGDTFEFLIYPKNSEGAPFDDLSGYSATFTIAPSRGATATLSSNVEGELSTLIEDNNHVTCTILPSGGNELTGQSYVYDVEIENTITGKTYTLITGTITVTQDVTRV